MYKRQVGFYKGVWSDVVTEALELWVGAHTSAHNKRKPRPDVAEAWNDVKAWLLDNIYDVIPNVLPGEHLQEAIRGGLKVRDDRAVRNWLKCFMANGIIKPLQEARNPLRVRAWAVVG